ncbi:ADP-ribosyltransferase exoenzyme domain protein [Klosneuvirus KNV1]|uniref:ADP-ribosyltransferase exoenzyme domain protein n=1 Tax=Klosneuvirus KNV1 TaxID=1977640 RepID=A0A1V0SI50_9VIRU|nr:ADP-ribosyltransferase exoenzyme domain protein [Klosneuvirus KNV1]
MSLYLLFYKDTKTIKEAESEKVFDDLYYLRASIPTKENIKDYIKTGKNKKIKDLLKNGEPEDIIKEIKEAISKIDHSMPLYDEYSKNIYLIKKSQVYNRVMYQYYRFPDESLIRVFKEREKKLKPKLIKIKETINKEQNLGEFKKTQDIHYETLHKNIRLQREYRKLTLMLEFLNSFNIEILQTTYIKIFYFYANEVGKNITVCIRPSFMPHYKHIKPYYGRSELINMALNMSKIRPSDKYYDKEEVMKLCDIVKKNDITSETLVKHQEYIINTNRIGVVQYYSLQGSYFMNKYMRNLVSYAYKNELLESIIRSTWELILDAPAFDKEYILYRFIHDDEYLKHLKVNDVFIDPSFISTTRDPFYRSEIYKFGFILLKIKVPKNKKGVGICIEPYSHFPAEEEIILPPLSMLRLDKKDDNVPYYHTDDMYATQIKTRYEFTYVDHQDIKFADRPLLSHNQINNLNFLKLKKSDAMTIYEKIKQFIDTYVNEIYQFKTTIGNKEYDLIVEWYDSTSAYRDFYATTTKNGFSIYTIKNNYILFFIEISEENGESVIYVNYYFRYAASSPKKEINDADFIEFIAKLAHYFDINQVILYTEYASCDLERELVEQTYRGGNYCVDFYKYFKFNEKRFQNEKIKIDLTEMRTAFNYYDLDRIKTVDPLDQTYKIIRHSDEDEIYQIYQKTYKPYIKEEKYNLADFYVWMIDHQCVHANQLVHKFERLYKNNNPFDSDFYFFDPERYLYNKGLITEIPLVKTSKKESESAISDRNPKNEYRLEFYRRSRVPTI